MCFLLQAILYKQLHGERQKVKIREALEANRLDKFINVNEFMDAIHVD